MVMYVSQVELAKELGISQPRIALLKKQGVFKGATRINGKRVRFDLEKAKAVYDERVAPVNRVRKSKLTQREKVETVKQAKLPMEMDYSTARTLNEQYKAALKKLEFEERSGQLIGVDVVERTAFESGRKIRDQLQNVADRCSALVAAETDPFECKRILSKEINFILEELVNALQIPK
jgi:phage terminase Nu1 subunit (DNA packaging protein)